MAHWIPDLAKTAKQMAILIRKPLFQQVIDCLAYHLNVETELGIIFPVEQKDKDQGFSTSYIVYKWKHKTPTHDLADFYPRLDPYHQDLLGISLKYSLNRQLHWSCNIVNDDYVPCLLVFFSRIHGDISFGYPVSDKKEICACYYEWFTYRDQYKPNICAKLVKFLPVDELASLVWDFCVFPNIFAMFGYFSPRLRQVLIDSFVRYNQPI